MISSVSETKPPKIRFAFYLAWLHVERWRGRGLCLRALSKLKELNGLEGKGEGGLHLLYFWLLKKNVFECRLVRLKIRKTKTFHSVIFTEVYPVEPWSHDCTMSCSLEQGAADLRAESTMHFLDSSLGISARGEIGGGGGARSLGPFSQMAFWRRRLDLAPTAVESGWFSVLSSLCSCVPLSLVPPAALMNVPSDLIGASFISSIVNEEKSFPRVQLLPPLCHFFSFPPPIGLHERVLLALFMRAHQKP